MAVKNERRLANWIGGFLEYTKGMPSVPIFRQWSAITTLAAAMTRRVWTEGDQSIMYPNMTTLLVGKPSTGKGFAIKTGQKLLSQIDYSYAENPTLRTQGIRLGTDDATGAGLFDEFLDEQSLRIAEYAGQKTDFRSLVVVAEEAVSFFANLDNAMMGMLIKFINCDKRVSQRRRNAGEQKHIDRPVLSILAGIQPAVFDAIFPPEAWEMGLLARANFIFSDEVKKVPLTGGGAKPNPQLFKDLVHDLKIITGLNGPFLFSEEAVSIVNHWWMELADEDRPTHPRLINYTSKRLEHLVRLCMVNSIARSNNLIIEELDIVQALKVLHQAEDRIMGMFANTVGAGSHDMAMMDVLHQVEALVRETGNPAPHYTVAAMIGKKVPAGQAGFVLDQMKAQRMLTEVRPKGGRRLPGPGGNKAFIPFVKPQGEQEKE